METIQVKVQRLDNGRGFPLPDYHTPGAAGMDLRSAQDKVIGPQATAVVRTGLKMVVPEGYEIQIRSRGGMASKGIFVTNGPGTVDSDYRGEIMVVLTNSHYDQAFHIKRGDRIAQAVFAPVLRGELVEVQDVDETERGEGRFSSTGVR
jgi:dUTP pyrophosphatase